MSAADRAKLRIEVRCSSGVKGAKPVRAVARGLGDTVTAFYRWAGRNGGRVTRWTRVRCVLGTVDGGWWRTGCEWDKGWAGGIWRSSA